MRKKGKNEKQKVSQGIIKKISPTTNEYRRQQIWSLTLKHKIANRHIYSQLIQFNIYYRRPQCDR